MRKVARIAAVVVFFSIYGCQKEQPPANIAVEAPPMVAVAPPTDEIIAPPPQETSPPTNVNDILPSAPPPPPKLSQKSATNAAPAPAPVKTEPEIEHPKTPATIVTNTVQIQSAASPNTPSVPPPAASASGFDFCSVIRTPQSTPQNNEIIRVATRGLSRKPDTTSTIDRLAPFQGNGRSGSPAQADDLALSDLQSNLVDYIQQNPKNCNATAAAILDVCRKNGNSSDSQTELPILGANFSREQGNAGLKVVHAELDERSLPYYEKQLEKERRELDELFNTIQSEDNGKAVDAKRKAAVRIKRYIGLAVVAAALGQRAYLQQTESIEKILVALASFQNVASIDEAAAVIVASLGREKVQAFPVRRYDAFEITPFSAALYDKMQVKLAKRSASSADSANYLLAGNYQICGNGDMILQYDLTDKNNLVVDSVVLRIEKDIYSRYRTVPATADFDKSFLQKTSADGGFRSDITTNRGNRDLLLRDGESIQFYARLTEPGYFFVIGHVMQQDGKRFSYLLELNNDPNNKFVVFVPPDKANQYIDLGEYEMGAPFGTEYMQLMASTQNPVDMLPPTRWDSELELNVIDQASGAPKEVVERVRAAKKVKKQTNLKAHESVLTYTTMSK